MQSETLNNLNIANTWIYINHKFWEKVIEYDKLMQLVSVVGEIIAESDMERWSRIAQPSFVI